MEWSITETSAPRLVAMRVSGQFSIGECRRAIAELSAIKEFLTAVLFDDREVDFSGVTDDDLLEMAAMLVKYGNTFRFCRIAVLVASDADRELADRWRRVSNVGGQKMIKVFFDEEEAIAWLHRRESAESVELRNSQDAL